MTEPDEQPEHIHRWRFINSRDLFVCLDCGETDDGQ